jgi:CPA1 family monovalent cation:H+ antiporter
LFNDGVAVVSFLTLLGIATGTTTVDGAHIVLVLGEEVLGGILVGLLLGWISYRLIRSADSYQVEIFLTLALVAGAYALSESLHVSAPITVVVAGLLIGNHGRSFAMTETTRARLDAFWELVDEFLNAILFVLIGLEIIALHMNMTYVITGMLTIIAVLIGRFASVAIPLQLMRLRRAIIPGTIRVLTWCGLRGGISIAMALSLPISKERELILAITYVVVIFSVLVQGLSVGRLVQCVTLPRPTA